MAEDDMQDKSEFNYAVSFLERCNYFFGRIAIAKEQMDIYGWYINVFNLFSEMCDELGSGKEFAAKKKELRLLFDDVNKWMQKKGHPQMKRIQPELYWQLFDFEVYVRKLINSQGYKTKRKDDFLAPEEEW